MLAAINSIAEVAVLIACPFLVRASLGLPRMAWAKWAGAVSYPLYATHAPLIQAARAMGLPPLIGLVLAAAVALLVTLVFEMRRPTRRPAVAF